MAQSVERGSKRRSRIRYKTNPSATADNVRAANRPYRVGMDIHHVFIANEKTKNLIDPGVAVFHKIKKVDTESFVKMYATGINRTARLGKTGLAVLEIVLRIVRDKENKNRDRIPLAYDLLADEEQRMMSKRTFLRGLSDLIDRELVYPSNVNNIYFIDITCMFNGDRFQVIDEYRRVDTQGDLFHGKDDDSLQDQVDAREAA